MRDAPGYLTTFQYDPANRQKLIVDPHDEHTLLAYYPDGTLLSETRPGPRVTSYQYDLAQRRTRVADPLGRVSTTLYDANGLVWSQADPSGEVTTFGYDAADCEIPVPGVMQLKTPKTAKSDGLVVRMARTPAS